VFITALVLGLVGVALSIVAVHATFTLLRLDARETLMWLGLAEVPPPPTSRRGRHRVGSRGRTRRSPGSR